MKTDARLAFVFSPILLAFVLSMVASGFVRAADLAPRTDRDGGVEVKVTPRALSTDAVVWEFDVVFSTHTVTLAGDPAQFSRLVDPNGREHAPLAWQGDPPGGHHRKGVLRFKPLAAATQVELRISGVGGVVSRRFRWELR